VTNRTEEPTPMTTWRWAGAALPARR
jgi:hypothetical protein